MSKTLGKVPARLIQASKVRVRPILQDGDCFWMRLSQCSVRSYSSSGIRSKYRNDINTNGVAKADAANFDDKSFNDQSIDDMDFDTWVSKMLRKDPSIESIDKILKVDQHISMKPLRWESDGQDRMAIGMAFQNPQVANALTSPLLASLTDAFKKIASNQSIGGVFLTSGLPYAPDTHFCAGAHTGELLRLQEPDAAEAFIRKVSGLCTAIRDTPVPVIALISGSCIGAGLEVAASCDIRIATKDAEFRMPEVILKIPSVVQARLLCDIVGWGRARHLMLTGHTWTAQEAYEAGLVTKLFDSKSHMMNWAWSYMRQVNTISTVYRAQKQLMKDWENQSVDAGIEAGVRCFADTFAQKKDVKAIQNSIRKAIKIKKDEKSTKKLETSQSEDNTSVSEKQVVGQVQDKDSQHTHEELAPYIRKTNQYRNEKKARLSLSKDKPKHEGHAQ